MQQSDFKAVIESRKTALGIEFGSTRIKAVLVDARGESIASGGHEWENKLENDIWTYDLADVWTGLRACYADLKRDVNERYGTELGGFGALGISAMMHGYLAFDGDDELLVPFRTWRNTITGQAAAKLTEMLDFSFPQRWSVAHLYQAIMNGEQHVDRISFITTLAGYVHWKLTGKKVLGVGDASGVFPIDSETGDFDRARLAVLDRDLAGKGYPWRIGEILPEVLSAGADAGTLSAEGAKLLDPTGALMPGIPMCPPEGDAGTGMVATNSVAQRTGNVSAGTSVFAMIVLEKGLSKVYTEIDMVTTPSGRPVAMVHCNNCTSDLNAWVGLFGEFAEAMGMKPDTNRLFSVLYNKALEADKDGGGLMAYNYLSGEHLTEVEQGRPMFLRLPDAKFRLANFMRTHLYAALGTLKLGMGILTNEEKVGIDCIFGHGGLFKTKGVAQGILAAALNTPVSIMETAGEGGAWGIALLAQYMVTMGEGETLEAFLENRIFADKGCETMQPDPEDVRGFEAFMVRFEAGLPIERAAKVIK